MRYSLENKVVFITGASAGIGMACVKAVHQAGARVVAAARSFDKLEALGRECGDGVFPVQLDVTDAEQRANAIASVRRELGPIDVLVNNAGWACFGSVEKMPLDDVRRMVDLNFIAAVDMARLVLPEMVARRSGQIVNVSSVVGGQAIPRMTVYGATKAALWSFSSGLRMELRGTGVDVVLVAPGSTRTGFFEAAGKIDATAKRLAKTQYPPEGVARAIVSACIHRRREVVLSVEGKTILLIRRFSHRLADAIMTHVGKRAMPVRAESDR
jgi:short-subunit dehydrogenase